MAKPLLSRVPHPQCLVPHLDEGVQGLAIHLQELSLNVQHVNLSPGNHNSDQDTICGAQPLTGENNRLAILCLIENISQRTSVIRSIHNSDFLYIDPGWI